MRVRKRPAARAVTATLLVAACAAPAAATVPGAGGAPAGDGATELRASGEFTHADPEEVPRAVTYLPELVPAGAGITVRQEVVGDTTVVRLAVSGLRPGHTYGTHVHTAPCGADPDDAGPHYQDVPGDAPELATPENEVWLDFTAGADGTGYAVSRHDWTFRPGEAASVVIHERATSTGEDGVPPGDAGARAGCLTVPFAGYAAGGVAGR